MAKGMVFTSPTDGGGMMRRIRLGSRDESGVQPVAFCDRWCAEYRAFPGNNYHPSRVAGRFGKCSGARLQANDPFTVWLPLC
jgi:hypothetical protein